MNKHEKPRILRYRPFGDNVRTAAYHTTKCSTIYTSTKSWMNEQDEHHDDNQNNTHANRYNYLYFSVKSRSPECIKSYYHILTYFFEIFLLIFTVQQFPIVIRIILLRALHLFEAETRKGLIFKSKVASLCNADAMSIKLRKFTEYTLNSLLASGKHR